MCKIFFLRTSSVCRKDCVYCGSGRSGRSVKVDGGRVAVIPLAPGT